MATYGVVPEGFNVKPLDAILADVQSKQLAGISPNLDVQATALIGNLNGIFGAELADAWLAIAADYNGMDADGAAGSQLTSLAELTGTDRSAAQPTVVATTVNVNAGFHADARTMFASLVSKPAAIFTNNADVDNPGGVPANIAATFEAIDTGPQQALAATLIVIAQALTGWNSITNAIDGVVGSNTESDPSLRLKRQTELATAGSATTDAIRADILEGMQPPITTTATINVTVLENTTDAVDSRGLSPHSIEVIAYQPGATADDNQALANLIGKAKSGGIATYGLTSSLVTDDQGFQSRIYYSRPTPKVLWIAITVIVTKAFPLDGDTLVELALLNYATLEYGPGQEVILDALKSSVYPSPVDSAVGVPGVHKVSVFKVDTIDPPVNTADIAVGVREVADFDSSRIAVTVIPL